MLSGGARSRRNPVAEEETAEEEQEADSLSAGQLEFLRRKRQMTGAAGAEASSVAADANTQQQSSRADFWGSVAAAPSARCQPCAEAPPFEKSGLCVTRRRGGARFEDGALLVLAERRGLALVRTASDIGRRRKCMQYYTRW
jgi:hypothetical protein